MAKRRTFARDCYERRISSRRTVWVVVLLRCRSGYLVSGIGCQ